ncbi:uncharacterized protein LOC141690632 [Apium graveolens]|uniref:uncharacterized protein LOC141690632 n=1 Tax=Apium graveolens TaxID=4045 RepID=UPI003D78BAF6
MWAQWIPWAKFWYNTTPHMAINMTPFKALYGRDPPHLLRLGSGHTPKMKAVEDGHRRDEVFTVGEKVYLKLQPYRQKSLARRPFEKLATRYYGPYSVLKRVGMVANHLDLPSDCKIHPVFHVSQLKRAIGIAHASPTLPAQLTSELEMVVEPETLLDVRNHTTGQSVCTKVLIKWRNLPDFEATWEDLDHMQQHFPDFHLEDKVALWVAGNAMTPPIEARPPTLITYARKQHKGRKGNTTTKEGQ